MRISTLKCIFLALVMVLVSGSLSYACNLSSITLCGVTGSGPYTICIQVCNGYGRTGTTKGADNDTRSISFGWYDAAPPGFAIASFTPPNIVSGRGFSNCTMPGMNIGPQGPPYNSQGTIIYVDPGYYGVPPCVVQPFGCVTSTALCGPASQQCITYNFVVNQVPDSVRVYGVEGGGNPIAGCYPDADMMINFTTLAVEWGNFEGIPQENSVKLKWSTLSETNTDLFVVERASASSSEYTPIGDMAASGFSAGEVKYEFVDMAPMPGINRYRLLQVDKGGNTTSSAAIEVNFASPAGLTWGAVGPNPATNHMDLNFFNDRAETMTLSVYDLQGKAVIQKEIQGINGANTIQLNMEKVEAGAYFVRVEGAGGKLTRKVIKL